MSKLANTSQKGWCLLGTNLAKKGNVMSRKNRLLALFTATLIFNACRPMEEIFKEIEDAKGDWKKVREEFRKYLESMKEK